MRHQALFFILMCLGIPLSASAIDLPEDFSVLDTNADDQIDFAEFSQFAATQDISRTLAAQRFVAMSAGNAVITRGEYFLAREVSESPTWRDGYALKPMSEPVSDVEPAELTTSEPMETDQTLYEKTPNEEVAGVVIRSFENDPWNSGLFP